MARVVTKCPGGLGTLSDMCCETYVVCQETDQRLTLRTGRGSRRTRVLVGRREAVENERVVWWEGDRAGVVKCSCVPGPGLGRMGWILVCAHGKKAFNLSCYQSFWVIIGNGRMWLFL